MRKRNLLLSIISGIILALAIPKPGIWLFAWVGLVPLFVALRDIRPRQAVIYGFIAGLVYFGIILYCITLFGYLPWLLLIVYQALYIAVFALLYTFLTPQKTGWTGYFAIPAAWTVLQWVRSLGTYAFNWGSFSHTQADNLVVSQMASVTGVWGIDFLVCLVNFTIAATLFPYAKRRFTPAIIVGVITFSICAAGYWTIKTAPASGGSYRVAIIQGNIKNSFNTPPDYCSRVFDTYSRMSVIAARSKPDAIIWPETTLPTCISGTGWEPLIRQQARRYATDLFIGGYDMPDKPNQNGSYNTLFFYNADGNKKGVYHKVRLVPFGEFVPLRSYLPFLNNYGVRPEDVLAGKSHELLDCKMGKVGVSICFESLFPEISRTETRRGANILFVVTNDSWFEHTSAARQHFMFSKLRAIENRRYVVRTAATGISAIIDPYGRTVSQLGMFNKGIVEGQVSALDTVTIHTRFGAWFVYICLLIIAITSARKFLA